MIVSNLVFHLLAEAPWGVSPHNNHALAYERRLPCACAETWTIAFMSFSSVSTRRPQETKGKSHEGLLPADNTSVISMDSPFHSPYRVTISNAKPKGDSPLSGNNKGSGYLAGTILRHCWNTGRRSHRLQTTAKER